MANLKRTLSAWEHMALIESLRTAIKAKAVYGPHAESLLGALEKAAKVTLS